MTISERLYAVISVAGLLGWVAVRYARLGRPRLKQYALFLVLLLVLLGSMVFMALPPGT
jgi:Na+/serine symporter